MRVRAECTIDLDDKRRVWVQLDAEGVETDDQLRQLAGATAEAALRGYEKAHERSKVEPQGAEVVREARRRKDDLRGMGEID